MVQPLNEKIGKLVDQFLDDSDYYERFEGIAQTYGVVSDNPDVVKVAMFSVQKDELIFIAKELEELFFEWQLFERIKDQEPYSSLLTKFPERKSQVIKVAKNLLEGKDLTEKDLTKLFKGLDDER